VFAKRCCTEHSTSFAIGVGIVGSVSKVMVMQSVKVIINSDVTYCMCTLMSIQFSAIHFVPLVEIFKALNCSTAELPMLNLNFFKGQGICVLIWNTFDVNKHD